MQNPQQPNWQKPLPQQFAQPYAQQPLPQQFAQPYVQQPFPQQFAAPQAFGPQQFAQRPPKPNGPQKPQQPPPPPKKPEQQIAKKPASDQQTEIPNNSIIRSRINTIKTNTQFYKSASKDLLKLIDNCVKIVGQSFKKQSDIEKAFIEITKDVDQVDNRAEDLKRQLEKFAKQLQELQ